jgi:Na+-transporting NADH:ubiquinone oxidoreductase subunit A
LAIRLRTRKGLDVQVGGEPIQKISEANAVSSVAVLGGDYPGLRPSLLVAAGDPVRLGQPLFLDRRHPDVLYTAPGGGIVTVVNRGERRTLASVVVSLDAEEDEVAFDALPGHALQNPDRARVVARLLESGLWTALRERPFGGVPGPGAVPRSLFITAMDTNPLAARPEFVIAAHARDFADGLAVLGCLTDGPVFLCKAVGAEVPAGEPERVTVAEFSGPHPAGLPGTHIHFLDPVGGGGTVWQIGYQDVIAVGRLFTTGRLWMDRVVAITGPAVHRARLVQTRLGANLDDLLRGEVGDDGCQIVSGSVLSGRRATEAQSFLGRHDVQVSVVPADGAGPASRPGPMLPLDTFDSAMPLGILPSPLLRALLVGDVDMARRLGCLELVEEDVALMSYLCPGGNDYGPLLRACLDDIRKGTE